MCWLGVHSLSAGFLGTFYLFAVSYLIIGLCGGYYFGYSGLTYVARRDYRCNGVNDTVWFLLSRGVGSPVFSCSLLLVH